MVRRGAGRITERVAEEVADTMFALSTPSRVQILASLLERPRAVSELMQVLGMEQSAVSHQLRVLRDHALVKVDRVGRRRVYALHDEHVNELLEQALRHVEQRRRRSLGVSERRGHALLADALSDMGISASQVGRILAELDIKPHLVRSWLERPDDPTVWERAADVCGLYLGRPANALVLSVDEKTAIPARSRKHPTKPVARGRPERQEFEYRRHRTACLIAALNVHTGEVIATDTPRNNSANFITFLEQLDSTVPSRKTIHLVLDNGSSHVSKATKAWLAVHPRFVAHYTPKHASWLNQVELFFSILTRQLLRRGEFDSRDDLINRIMGFIGEHNRTAKAFRWTYDGTPLKAA